MQISIKTLKNNNTIFIYFLCCTKLYMSNTGHSFTCRSSFFLKSTLNGRSLWKRAHPFADVTLQGVALPGFRCVVLSRLLIDWRNDTFTPAATLGRTDSFSVYSSRTPAYRLDLRSKVWTGTLLISLYLEAIKLISVGKYKVWLNSAHQVILVLYSDLGYMHNPIYSQWISK